MLEKNRHQFNATEQRLPDLFFNQRLPDLNVSNSVNKRSSVEPHQGIGEEFLIGSITGVLSRDDVRPQFACSSTGRIFWRALVHPLTSGCTDGHRRIGRTNP